MYKPAFHPRIDPLATAEAVSGPGEKAPDGVIVIIVMESATTSILELTVDFKKV
ncbi:hypothetical protein [Pyrobaculum aerophilum]|uniref:hypothetical protein n=1 Tax=Pyrobaculum aerophilum TaxID=13773 RepID=UPI000A41C6E3